MSNEQMNGEKREALKHIVRIVSEASGNVPVFLIGGMVRDLIRGGAFADYDIDFTVEGDSTPIVERVAKALGGKVKTFPAFFTSKILGISLPITEIDFAETRTESYRSPGALPTVVRANFEEDLKRRDFTINTLALPLSGFLAVLNGEPPDNFVIDKFDGIKDLRSNVVRILHPQSFNDDPTRIFRAARYVARISGGLSDDTKECLEASVKGGSLLNISGQRRWNEIKKILSESKPSSALRVLADWGVYQSLNLISDSDSASFIASIQSLEGLNFLTAERGAMILYGNLTEDARGSFEKESGFGKKVLSKFHDTLQSAVSYAPGSDDDVAVLALVLCHRTEKKEGIIKELQERGLIPKGS